MEDNMGVYTYKKVASEVSVASPELLKKKEYYYLIWKTLRDLELSRRALAEEIVNILMRAGLRDTVFRHADGRRYDLPEFDDAFTDDPSRRWFGAFLEADDASGQKPERYSHNVARMEILDIAAKLVSPQSFRTAENSR
jgi:hypothetical protein